MTFAKQRFDQRTAASKIASRMEAASVSAKVSARILDGQMSVDELSLAELREAHDHADAATRSIERAIDHLQRNRKVHR